MTGLACAGHDLTNVNLRLLAKMIALAPHHRALGCGKKTDDHMSRGFPEKSEETVGLCPQSAMEGRTENSYGSVAVLVPGHLPTQMPDLFPTCLMPFQTFSEIFRNRAGPACRLMVIIRICIRSTWSQQTPRTTCK